MKSNKKPVFVLGVGAQKSGTSWLHGYLVQNKFVNMGFQKEYHVWDVKFKPDLFGEFRPKLSNPDGPINAMRRMMCNSNGFYEKYFRGLISAGVYVTDDITPSYSTLSADNFSFIKNKLESVGFEVRVVFFMRDPVQRCWSAIRMALRNQRKSGRNVTDVQAFELFSNSFHKKFCESRTRYDLSIKELTSVFSKENLYVGIYEEMFNEDKMIALSDFLSIPVNLSFASVKKNESPELMLPLNLQKKCFDFYKITYEYCYKNYPQSKELWTNFS